MFEVYHSCQADRMGGERLAKLVKEHEMIGPDSRQVISARRNSTIW